jgi:hypothetical protein
MTRFSLPPSRTNHLDGGSDHGSDKIRNERKGLNARRSRRMRDDLEMGTRTNWQIDLYQGARRCS